MALAVTVQPQPRSPHLREGLKEGPFDGLSPFTRKPTFL